MRILLIPSKNNYPSPAPDTTSFGQAMPYLAASLKQTGHDVFGLNLNHQWCHGSAPLALEKSIRQAVKRYQPHIIGLGGLAPDYLFVRDAILFARRIAPDTPVVIGGGLVTYDPEFIFQNLNPDFAITGEGERSIVFLADYLEKGGDIAGIPSLVYKKNGQACINKTEPPQDLNHIPFPDYELFDFVTYLEKNNHANNYLAHTRLNPRILPISTGRSCPYQCTFCCHNHAPAYRIRSIDNIMDEILHFYQKYHFNILYIHDELLAVKSNRAKEFFERIKELKRNTKADFDIGCYLRVNDADIHVLSLMKDAGVSFIGYGLESGSDNILKSMRKGSTREKIIRALDLTEKENIGVHGNFIFGDIAETNETIKETIDFYRKYCTHHTVYFFYITPYPGSEIFDYCEQNHLLGDRETYYKTIAFSKGSVNMTAMSDDEFYKNTRAIMSDMYNGYNASIVSFELLDKDTCDDDFPFELRRSFYGIDLICPHCGETVRHEYPLRLDLCNLLSFNHSCPLCHRRYFVDLTSWNGQGRLPDNAIERLFFQNPYSMYYPFSSLNYGMPSITSPFLIEAYKKFNIIKYGKLFYAFAQAIGPFDLTKLDSHKIDDYCLRGLCFRSSSVAESKQMVDTHGH